MHYLKQKTNINWLVLTAGLVGFIVFLLVLGYQMAGLMNLNKKVEITQRRLWSFLKELEMLG